jgi:hypothetical protein
MIRFGLFGVCALIVNLASLPTALAQEVRGGARAVREANDLAWRRSVPDPAGIQMPDLAFSQTPGDEQDYDKYFYFNRASTSFASALADLRDCDELSRGLKSSSGTSSAAFVQGGAVGGLVANLIGAAIFGSAEKRRVRRVNMRRCMNFKGYARYGLRKTNWESFNFEEGLNGLSEPKRQGFLFQLAKVASGPAPSAKELGL